MTSSTGNGKPMRIVHKAFALVVRPGDTCAALLIFGHSLTKPQIPKGTVEPGEDDQAAALRELEEESGLTSQAVRVVRKLGVHRALVHAGPTTGPQGGPLEDQHWHLFLLEPITSLANAWDHSVA